MFSRAVKPVVTVVSIKNGAKNLSTTPASMFKVVVAGAAGGIGQPLSLLLKLNPLVSDLTLYDIAPVTPGVAADLSHMDTPARVSGFKGPENLAQAVKGAHVVVIPAGVPRKPGMTRDDLFNTNASIVRDLAEVVAQHAPKTILAVITNPVNSMVPIAAEVMKKHGVFDPKRVIGVTTLDIVRSKTFIGEINGVDPRNVSCPVVGGHSGITIVPVLSQANPVPKITDQAKIEALTKRIQEAGTEVVKAKAGGGSATLSMGWAGARLTDCILRGLNGEDNIVACAFIKSDLTEAKYFANPIKFGKEGVAENLGYGKLNAYEESLLKAAMPELLKNIKKGEEFVTK